MTRTLIGTIVFALTASAAGAEHQHAAPPAAAPTADAQECAQAQIVVDGVLERMAVRLETSRLSNTAADMRAVNDALQGSVRDLRAQLAPCAALRPADPHAGHLGRGATMPAAAVADAHAGHTMPSGAAANAAPAAERADHTAHAAQTSATSAKAAEEILAWIKGYDAAFLAKDLDRLATFYYPDVTIYEGAGIDNGWLDYRDTHLGPELKAFEDLSFGHTNYAVRMLSERAAYVTSEFFIKAKMPTRMLDLIGRETLVVEKDTNGAWKIRHSHTGTRARPAK